MSGPIASDLQVSDDGRILTLYGVKYAIELFEHLGVGPIGSRIEIVSREDGAVTVKRLPDETDSLHRVGAILAEIVEMGTSTVARQPKGFRWPWSWEAENALRLLGKRATDYFPPKVDDAAGRTYWDCDFDLAIEARGRSP